MTRDFAHILLSLRKERKLTQKQAAKELDISPALLSHYEKGIRECGLQFVVRAADYYHVSCDYLLGRTTDRSGMAPELASARPLELAVHENKREKQALQAVHILFQALEECGHERLTAEAASALSLTVYGIFRELSREDNSLFALPRDEALLPVQAAIAQAMSRVRQLSHGHPVGEDAGLTPDEHPTLSEEDLRREYPFFVSSLTRLIRDAEETVGALR